MLDSGDLFHAGNSVPAGKQETVKGAAEVIVRAYNKQGCDAVGLGDRDLAALGVEELKRLASQAKFPFLNANVRGSDGKPAFSPYVVLEKGGYKIGVFALVTPNGAFSGELGYKVTLPIDAARQVMAQLEKEALDAIVLLAHMEQREAQILVDKVKGIDVLLGGQSMTRPGFLNKVGEGWWVDPGQRGQHLNVVTLHVGAGGQRPFVLREDGAKLQRQLIGIDRKLKQYEGLLNRQESSGGRQNSRPRIKQVIARMLKQREELAAVSRQMGKVPENAPFLTLESVPMRKNLRDDDEVLRWVRDFKSKAPAGCGG